MIANILAPRYQKSLLTLGYWFLLITYLQDYREINPNLLLLPVLIF